MTVNTLGMVTAVVQHHKLVAEFIKVQLLYLKDHCLGEFFRIAASESVPAVPAHCREAGLFREQIGIIEIIES